MRHVVAPASARVTESWQEASVAFWGKQPPSSPPNGSPGAAAAIWTTSRIAASAYVDDWTIVSPPLARTAGCLYVGAHRAGNAIRCHGATKRRAGVVRPRGHLDLLEAAPEKASP